MAIFLSATIAAGAVPAGEVVRHGADRRTRFELPDRVRPESEEGHLFFENTHQVPRESASARESIAQLDLNYYIPCRAQQHVIAFLGLGKTVDGDFLSSEDVELLETLAGYIGIAIQNARLYASLEQKAAEYERLKDFNENIVESINVGVLAVDLEDRIESWNSQMEVMYALPRWQALGRPLSEVFPAAFVEEFYRVRQNSGIHNLYKFRLGTPTGEVRTVNVAIAPLVTKKFSVIGRLIIVDDITERIELESQLSQADKLSSIGLLAAGVAHEVNTPLAVISSYAQMLSKQVTGDAQKSALLEKITRQTFRASEIVNNLLNFSRTSSAEFTEVDLNKIIEDTLALLEHQFKTSGVRVQDELNGHLPVISGNSGTTAAGVSEPVPERAGRHARRRDAAGRHVERRRGQRDGFGHRQRHRARTHPPHLRPVLHHESGTAGRPGEGHRPGTLGDLRHHSGACGQDPGGEPAWRRHNVHLEFPMMRKAVNV